MTDLQHPIYKTLTDNDWDEKIQRARELMSPCVLCERRCNAFRLEANDSRPKPNSDPNFPKSKPHSKQLGFCESEADAVISSFSAHFGEERPLVGVRGSGTVFFTSCNLKCDFCQNYDIAHFNRGHEVSDEELASVFLRLQKSGCHNINLVSPTHFVFSILKAVRIASRNGLSIPIVYNTGGYDSPETLHVLHNVVDIYMPDMKFGNSKDAAEFLHVSDYASVNFAAVKEMHRQVGDLVTKNGIAKRGLLVRHLVLPENMAGTEQVMQFIAEHISKNTYVNIMDQYTPYYKTVHHPVLGRRIRAREYDEAVAIARKAGLRRLP